MKAKDLIEALTIITTAEPRAKVETGGVLFCGAYAPEKLTPEQRERLVKLGWYEDEESWARYT